MLYLCLLGALCLMKEPVSNADLNVKVFLSQTLDGVMPYYIHPTAHFISKRFCVPIYNTHDVTFSCSNGDHVTRTSSHNMHYLLIQNCIYLYPRELNLVCILISSIQQDEDSFHQQNGLTFNEESSEVLHFEHSFVWCWNFGK